MESALRLCEHVWLLRGATDRAARHLFLRRLAATTLGCALDEIALAADGRGQPRLDAPVPLHVSLSHRPGLTLLGLAPFAIGVDVELIGTGGLDVARDHFSPAEARWLDGVSQPDAFVRLWTAKEAVLKATGQGIALGLAQPDLSPLLEPGRPLDCAQARIAGFDVTWRPFGPAMTAWALATDRHTETAIVPLNAAVPPGELPY